MLSHPFRIVTIRLVGFGRAMSSTMAILALLAAPAASISVGAARAGDQPDVEVNLGVLDTMNPARTPPNPSNRVTLHPPRQKKKTTTARSNAGAVNARPVATSGATSTTVPAGVVANETVAAAPREKVSATPLADTPPTPAAARAPSDDTAAVSAPPAPAVTAMNAEPAHAAPATTPSPSVTPAEVPAAIKSAASREQRVLFAVGASELPDPAKPDLDALAQELAADEQLRAQIVAYASGEDASQARRISLSRALVVRAYLIERGVGHLRLDVRALGNRPDNGVPPDRVDIVMIDH